MLKFLPVRYLNFLQRVSFICNGCFLLSLLFRIIRLGAELNLAVKTILVLGFVLALPLNFLVSLMLILLLIFRKAAYNKLPGWLFVTNLLLLAIELVYYACHYLING